MLTSYPCATGAELDLITDFHDWIWIFDDFFDKPGVQKALPQDTAIYINEFRNILLDPTHSVVADGSPLLIAWRQILNRIPKDTSEIWHQKHRLHWDEALQGYQEEAENSANGITPSFDEFLRLRRAIVCASICFDWMEAIGHYQLPAHVHADIAMVSMRKDAIDLLFLPNDIFSARNEHNDGNMNNIILVLAQHEGFSWRRASEVTHEMIAQKVSSFQLSEKQFYRSPCHTSVPQPDQENARKFIDGMKYWIRGSLDWHLTCPRYQ